MRLPSRIPATIEIQARRGARSRPSRSCSRATRSAACDAGSRISTATSCCPSCSARSHCTTSAPWRTVSRGARAPARSPRRPRSRVKVAPRLRSQALQRLLDRRGHRTAARDRAAQDRAPDRARLDLPRGQRPPLHHRGRARAVRLHAQLARARGTARNRRPRPHPCSKKSTPEAGGAASPLHERGQARMRWGWGEGADFVCHVRGLRRSYSPPPAVPIRAGAPQGANRRTRRGGRRFGKDGSCRSAARREPRRTEWATPSPDRRLRSRRRSCRARRGCRSVVGRPSGPRAQRRSILWIRPHLRARQRGADQHQGGEQQGKVATLRRRAGQPARDRVIHRMDVARAGRGERQQPGAEQARGERIEAAPRSRGPTARAGRIPARARAGTARPARTASASPPAANASPAPPPTGRGRRRRAAAPARSAARSRASPCARAACAAGSPAGSGRAR
jgi:hypothetical protein